MSLKNGVLEASGLDFGGPGLDFGGPETRFGKVLARFFRDSWPECQESQERQERLPKQDRDHKSAKSGWAAVLPPRGVSMELLQNRKKNLVRVWSGCDL